MAALAKNLALVALGATGAIFAVNQISKPSKAQGIAWQMGQQLDDYNSSIHPEQDPWQVSSFLPPPNSPTFPICTPLLDIMLFK